MLSFTLLFLVVWIIGGLGVVVVFCLIKRFIITRQLNRYYAFRRVLNLNLIALPANGEDHGKPIDIVSTHTASH